MSATADVQRLSSYFAPPAGAAAPAVPVVQVDGRTFPVTVGYNEEALRLVSDEGGFAARALGRRWDAQDDTWHSELVREVCCRGADTAQQSALAAAVI